MSAQANVCKWSMGDRQLFPPVIVSPALQRTGGYPQLPAGKATFQNRQVASGRQEKPDGLQLRLKSQALNGRKGSR